MEMVCFPFSLMKNEPSIKLMLLVSCSYLGIVSFFSLKYLINLLHSENFYLLVCLARVNDLNNNASLIGFGRLIRSC